MNNLRNLLTTGAIVLVLVFLLIYNFKNTMGGKVTSSNVAYYSADDGMTFFKAALNAPPYHAPDGRPASAAQVFSVDGGATLFVGYLMRAHLQGIDSSSIAPMGGGALEVKKPGPGHEWIPAPPPGTPPSSAEGLAYQEVVNPPSPTGRGRPVPLIPEQ